MNRMHWLIGIITAVLVLTTAAVGIWGCKEPNVNKRGPVFAAAEKTLAQPGPVRDDLIKRRMATAPTTDPNTGKLAPGEINIGEIEKLVKDGFYLIDKNGYLQFGPSYTPSK